VNDPAAPDGPAAPAARALVVAAIERAGADNPLLGIATAALVAGSAAGLIAGPGAGPAPDPGPGPDSRSAAGPVAGRGPEAGPGGPAGRLVDAVGAGLGHPEARVAASLVVLGYAARLVGPTLAVALRDGILLDARASRVEYGYDPRHGFTLALPDPTGWHVAPAALPGRWCAVVIDAHLRPFVDAVRAVVPVAAGLLWGNVASGLTGALRTLAATGAVPPARCLDVGLAVLDHGPLRGSGEIAMRDGRLGFRRRSCCLYYRLDGAGTCGDCPLTPPRHRSPA
jgi:ferric iron reductase protein FhuF